jgi:hypothetical protein
MPKGISKKTGTVTGNTLKSDVYCVLENSDGGRIMEVSLATEFLCNMTMDVRRLTTMHFAGTLDAARELMASIEDKKKLAEGTFFFLITPVNIILYSCTI